MLFYFAVQLIPVTHIEHDYYGDSDLEKFDDEAIEEGPEVSKSLSISDVCCLLLYMAVHSIFVMILTLNRWCFYDLSR
jgi:hypothetical protein